MKTLSITLVQLAFALVALALNLSLAPNSTAASFSNTGSLSGARSGHVATLLPNGTVLVTGGYDGIGPGRLASSEIYNPATGVWTNTGSLILGRTKPTLTLLPNGKVLIAGGHNSDTSSTAACELYDPTSGTWTNTGSMAAVRGWHTATLLLNGKVLVTGGYNRGAGYDLSSAELYDPVTGTWTYTGSMTTNRVYPTATLLLDGRVLVAGGVTASNGLVENWLSSAELYDPASGTWTTTGSMSRAKRFHTATLLPDGRVLVTGGDSGGDAFADAELYDPAIGAWHSTAAMANMRAIHTATLLPDGNVLVAGGFDSNYLPTHSLSSAELYDPALGTWASTGSLNTGRDGHSATLLPNGNVLVAAGYNEDSAVWLSSSEQFDSAAGPITLVHPAKLPDGVFQFTFTGGPNRTYTVLLNSDLRNSADCSGWTAVGLTGEIAPGLYLFSTPQEASAPQAFYRAVEGNFIVTQVCPGAGPYPCWSCPYSFRCVMFGATWRWSQYTDCGRPGF